MGRRSILHNAAGNKIIHPADAQRRQAKKRKLDKMKKERNQHFETRILGQSPEEIEAEIVAMKADHERKRAAKIDIHKNQIDRLTRLEAGYKRLKEQVEDRHKKRLAEPKSNLHVDFEELKVHRKSSIFYHPVNNPYGAPPTGQTLMYRHPDGSVKREPPPLPVEPSRDEPGAGDSEDESSASGSDDADDGGDGEPALPSELPDGLAALPIGPPLPPGLAPGLPPLPPGEPPATAGATPGPGLPPLPPGLPAGLPPGLPPGPGLPPLPPGAPPLPLGPPAGFGAPPLPLGPAPGFGSSGQPMFPPGQPQLPFAFALAAQAAGLPQDIAGLSQAGFAAELMQAGFQLPGVPLGPPPRASPAASSSAPAPFGPFGGLAPPGPPPKPRAPDRPKPAPARPPTPAAAPAGPVVSDLPRGAKAPPPPPKRGAAPERPGAGALKAATSFMPTSLRTKRPAQLAGGVLQVSSSSLSMEKRRNLVSTEVPSVGAALDIDEAFDAFLKEV